MADAQWYMAIGGHQIGPVAEAEIVANLQNGSASGDTLVFTTGMTDWTPLLAVPKFAASCSRISMHSIFILN